MISRTIVWRLGFVVVLVITSAAGVQATSWSCGTFTPAQGLVFADAVFDGTIVDQRFTVARQGPFLYPTIEYDVAVMRVWKGQASRRMVFTIDGSRGSNLNVGLTALIYATAPRYRFDPYFSMGCPPTVVVQYTTHLGELGAPIATFATLAPPASPSSRSWFGRVQAMWVLGLTHFTTLDVLVGSHRFWHDGLFVTVLVLQVVTSLWFLKRRRFGRWLGLSATAAVTTIVTLLWTGHSVLNTPIYNRLNQLL